MTDNPGLSSQSRPEGQHAVSRPRPWIALVALLAAPLAAAIVSNYGFTVGAWAWGYRTESVSLQDLSAHYFAFGFVLIPLGGLLTLMFWRRAPFGLVTSGIAGTVLGGAVGYLAVIIVFPGENYPSISATIVLGALSGLAGGLTFWLICRLSAHGTDD